MALLVVIGLVVWLVWLLSMARSKLDYVVQDASSRPVLPACEWVSVSAPPVATLGLSLEPTHAWTDRNEAMLAFRTESSSVAAFVDIRVVSVVAGKVSISADGAPAERVKGGGEVHLPLRASQGDVHTVLITTRRPLPPHGDDRRWLGAAVSAIRVCPAGS